MNTARSTLFFPSVAYVVLSFVANTLTLQKSEHRPAMSKFEAPAQRLLAQSAAKTPKTALSPPK